MSCKNVTARHSVCVIPVGSKRYDVVHRRKGSGGGFFIHETKRNLTKSEAKSAERKMVNDIKRTMKHIKKRRTPYP